MGSAAFGLYLSALVHPDRRGLHDIAANTIVVHRKPPGEKPPGDDEFIYTFGLPRPGRSMVKEVLVALVAALVLGLMNYVVTQPSTERSQAAATFWDSAIGPAQDARIGWRDRFTESTEKVCEVDRNVLDEWVSSGFQTQKGSASDIEAMASARAISPLLGIERTGAGLPSLRQAAFA